MSVITQISSNKSGGRRTGIALTRILGNIAPPVFGFWIGARFLAALKAEGIE